MIHLKHEWFRCYCGGWMKKVFTNHKRLTFGWKWNHYKKPRWQIDNCYPNEAIDASIKEKNENLEDNFRSL